MKKRVLWLSNNTAQREFEVPLLIAMGYEVFCPKICGYGLGEKNLSVSYQYDCSLSLDKEKLEKLNNFDLYADLDSEILSFINSSFDVVFVQPQVEVLRRLIHHFNGIIILRWTGDEDGLTCTERLITDGGYSLLYQINTVKDRFYFAYNFPWSIKDECDLLRGRSVYLPLPIEYKHEYVYQKGQSALVICPNVMLDDIAKNNFNEYLKSNKNFYVLGEQLVSPSNYKELFIDDTPYGENILKNAVAALDPGYKSSLISEPWILALEYGLPLIYTKKSQSYQLLGDSCLGCCKDNTEILKKTEKILNGSKNFAEKIIHYQSKALKEYTNDNCIDVWKKFFKSINNECLLLNNRKKRRKKICVILPEFHLVGGLSYTINFVTALYDEIKKHSDPVDLIFAHIKNAEYTNNNTFLCLKEMGIAVREITVKKLSKKEVKDILEIAGLYPQKSHEKLYIPDGVVYDDNINYLMDCDYLINTIDRSGGDSPILPLYPYAVVVRDYIQRYETSNAKSINKVVIPTHRNADSVFVTSVPCFHDALGYAMVHRERLHILPFLYKMQSSQNDMNSVISKSHKSYFLWPSNGGKHKNYLKALNVLDEYYRNNGKMKCRITGINSALMDPKTSLIPFSSNKILCNYMKSIRKYLEQHSLLYKNLIFDSYLTNEEFKETVKNACFIFYTGYVDNGTCIDAASLGIPSFCIDYPAMRYLSESTEIHCTFFNVNNPKEAAIDLEMMVNNYHKIALKLDYDKIRSHSLDYSSESMYQQLELAIGFRSEVIQ